MDVSSVNFFTSLSQWWSDLFSSVSAQPISANAIVALVASVALVVCSALMSSSEVAFFSLSPADLEEIKESDHPRDKKLKRLLEHSERLLATILIGNNIVNIALILLSSYCIEAFFDFGQADVLRFVLQTIVLTAVILLFCEIFPKVMARKIPLRYSRTMVPIILPLYKVIAWPAKALVRLGKRFQRTEAATALSVDDLSRAVELTEGKTPEQSEIMEGIIRFYDKTAGEIMTPRVDMVDIDLSKSFAEVISIIISSGYSRLPVYEGTEDNIKGILYIKDCIPYLEEDADFHWHKLIRKGYFVPENKMVDDLLEEFRSERIHMAIVVDEYGGTSGLITLEDILEEIVGEISDEYDQEELPYTLLPDGTYLFAAKTQLTDFCRLMTIDEALFSDIEQEVDTLAGVFLELKQEIPKIGDVVYYKEMMLKVASMDKVRIKELIVSIPETVRASIHEGS